MVSRADILSDLAEALGYPNGAGLAKAFAGMSASEQDKLLRRAKELVEVSKAGQLRLVRNSGRPSLTGCTSRKVRAATQQSRTPRLFRR